MLLIALILPLLVAVVVLGTIVWRLVRLDRQRSDVRTALLASAIDDSENLAAFSEPGDARLLIHFAPEARPAPATRTILWAAGGLAVLLSAALLLAGRSSSRPDPGVDARATASSSIELLSMRHARDGDTLIVSGLVRNRSASSTPDLTVVVSALGRDGEAAARGASRLDPLVLEPGKETPFRVSVTGARDLGRYRVAFVAGNRIVPHLDRRSDRAQTARGTD